MPRGKKTKDDIKPDPISHINIDKVRQLRPFKIDYSHVRKLEYIDKSNLKPQTFKEFRKVVPLKKLKITQRARPAFARDLRYLKRFSIARYWIKKVLVLVNHDLYPSIQS